MRAWVTVGIVTSLLAGCGGDEKKPVQKSDAALAAAGDWVRAVNAHDWDAACRLSVLSAGAPCQQLLSKAFEGWTGKVAVEGAYFARDRDNVQLSLAEAPPGFSVSGVERHGEKLLVHWEAQIIR